MALSPFATPTLRDVHPDPVNRPIHHVSRIMFLVAVSRGRSSICETGGLGPEGPPF